MVNGCTKTLIQLSRCSEEQIQACGSSFPFDAAPNLLPCSENTPIANYRYPFSVFLMCCVS